MPVDPFDRAIRQVVADILGRQALVRRCKDGSLTLTPKPGRPVVIRHQPWGLQLIDNTRCSTKWCRLFDGPLRDQAAELNDPDYASLKVALAAFGYSPNWDY